jgi:RNase H-like domain found in reverse transcriptase/Reverse transcriptase (RNA-dependent DNA polymerase)
MENKDFKSNMVENIKIEPRNDEIGVDSIVQELRRLNNMKFFISMDDETKLEYIISRASYELIDWHCKNKPARKTAFCFDKWKSSVIENFAKKRMTIGEVYRLKQRVDEPTAEFLRNVEDLCSEYDIKLDEKMDIILGGLLEGKEDIKRLLIKTKIIDKELLNDVNKLDDLYVKQEKKKYMESVELYDSNKVREIKTLLQELKNLKVSERTPLNCTYCGKSGHTIKFCWDKNGKNNTKNRINEVITEVEEKLGVLTNKENSFYINNVKFNVTLDTGACYNFVSRGVVKKLGIKPKNNFKVMKFYTCLEEPFEISQHVFLELEYLGLNYRMKFYVLPKVESLKVLVGRDSIKSVMQTPASVYVCEIKTPAESKVIEKIYPLPRKLEEGIDEAIQELLTKGYVRKSESTWLNNIRPVIKPNGKIRITTNLIALNKLVELDKYSLPNIEQILYNLHGMKFFSKIDLKDGFFQIPLAEKDKHKTAFRIKHKLYEWNVMPMGFKNAPAIFQRYMDNVLGKEIGRSCFVYVDDILIFGKDEISHDEAYERVFKLLKDNNLLINEEKTQYKKKEIEFLGHVLAENMITSKSIKIQGIQDMSRPENKRQLQSFLGLINYYRKFIPNCSTLGSPLYDLLKIKNVFEWNKESENAFNALKEALQKNIALNQPNFKLPFMLETDASNYGVGAVLSQNQGGEVVPIAFASRRLLEHEIKYSVSEKECLAILWGMEHFKYFLYGTNFEVITDHKALEVLNKGEINSLRIQRWMDRMSVFNYDIKYKKGTSIPHVDCLSRNCVEEVLNLEDQVNKTEEHLRERIRTLHVKLLHRGFRTIQYELSRQNVVLPNLGKLIKEELNRCHICKEYNPKKKNNFLFVTSYFKGEKVAIDIIGPIQNRYIITGIDYFTRKGYAKVISTRKEENVVEFIKEINQDLNIKMLVLDNSKENLSKKVKKYAEENKIVLHYTSPFHHQSNGRVERYNRTLQELVYKNKKDHLLINKVKRAAEVYNDSFHSGINMSPNEAMLEGSEEKIKETQFYAILKYNERNAGKSKEHKFSKNDVVMIKEEISYGKGKPKFKSRGVIIDDGTNNAYIVKVNNKEIKRHASQLKLVVDEVSLKKEGC